MKTFEEYWNSDEAAMSIGNGLTENCRRAFHFGMEAAKPRWLPILPETLFDADTDYLVRRKDEQYDAGYDVQLCQYENDIFGMFFWCNGNDEFPQGYFNEYMEIPK